MVDLTDHQMHRFRRGHDRHPHAFRRLRQFARREVAAASTLPTVATAPLRTELPAPATTASRLAPVVATAFTPVVTVATIVTLPTLARRFFVTGLRKFFRRCIPARPGRAEVECGQQALRQLIGGFAHAADPSDRSENDKPALRQSI
jgi:hypothetical protein